MSLLIHDRTISAALIEQRRASGLDRYDEVWDGVYVMSPSADINHQDLAGELTATLKLVIDWRGLGRTLPGANVSDRRKDWTHNYRIPDVLIFLNENSAENCGAFWLGGPDLAIEITSPDEHTLEKLGFYAKVRTSELLVIDRDPVRLSLYRRLCDPQSQEARMELVAQTSRSGISRIASIALGIDFEWSEDQKILRLLQSNQTIREITISA